MTQELRIEPREGDAHAEYTEIAYGINDSRKMAMRRGRMNKYDETDIVKQCIGKIAEARRLIPELPAAEVARVAAECEKVLSLMKKVQKHRDEDLLRYQIEPRGTRRSCWCENVSACTIPGALKQVYL